MRRLWVSLVAGSMIGSVASGAAQRATPSVELVASARVDAIEPAPACGDMHVAWLVTHQVISVERGSFAGGPLYVYYDCGQVSTRGAGMWSAERGRTFRLELSRTAPARFGAPVGQAPAGAPVYYAIAGRPAP
jgi:hypothetical protein